MNDVANSLNRFLRAQGYIYDGILKEIKSGKKKSHWMWFIFPQLRGLGQSSMSVFYGIKDLEEAKAYLEHPILGQRLIECMEVLLCHKDKSAQEIFGGIDEKKLCSCITLFSLADKENEIFKSVLEQFFGGAQDEETKRILKERES